MPLSCKSVNVLNLCFSNHISRYIPLRNVNTCTRILKVSMLLRADIIGKIWPWIQEWGAVTWIPYQHWLMSQRRFPDTLPHMPPFVLDFVNNRKLHETWMTDINWSPLFLASHGGQTRLFYWPLHNFPLRRYWSPTDLSTISQVHYWRVSDLDLNCSFMATFLCSLPRSRLTAC